MQSGDNIDLHTRRTSGASHDSCRTESEAGSAWRSQRNDRFIRSLSFDVQRRASGRRRAAKRFDFSAQELSHAPINQNRGVLHSRDFRSRGIAGKRCLQLIAACCLRIIGILRQPPVSDVVKMAVAYDDRVHRTKSNVRCAGHCNAWVV